MPASEEPASASPVSVRPLRVDDVDAYIALRREMLADSPWAFSASPEEDRGLRPERVAESVTSPGRAILGAFGPAGSPLLGAAGLTRAEGPKMCHRAVVWGVYVTPAMRSRGAGGALLRAALAMAQTWPGVTSVGLAVSEGSPAARRLYERVGFTAWGVEPAAVIVDGQTYSETHMIAFLNTGLPGGGRGGVAGRTV